MLMCFRRGRHYTCFLLLSANYGNNEVIPLSPTLLVCHVWLLQMVICCVFSGKPLFTMIDWFCAVGERYYLVMNATSWSCSLEHYLLGYECH
jgi:hypothetical protein